MYDACGETDEPVLYLQLGLWGEAVTANHVQRHKGGEPLDQVLNALVRDLRKGFREMRKTAAILMLIPRSQEA